MAETKEKAKRNTRTAKKSTPDKDSSVGRTSKEILDKGLEASKRWFEGAKKTISEWGDEGVKQVEIAKLNSKLNKGYAALGRVVYAKLASPKTASVSKADEDVGEIVKLLSDMTKQIKKLGGTPAKDSEEKASKKKAAEEQKALPDKTASAKKGSSKKSSASAEKTGTGRSRKTTTAKSAAKKPAAKKATAKKATRTSRAKKSED